MEAAEVAIIDTITTEEAVVAIRTSIESVMNVKEESMLIMMIQQE